MTSTIITVTIKSRTAARRQRYIRLFGRLTLTLLAAFAAASVLSLTIDIIAARAGSFGGEITLPVYVSIFIYFGWSLRGWVTAARKSLKERRENAPWHTITDAAPAAAHSTQTRYATAARSPKSAQ